MSKKDKGYIYLFRSLANESWYTDKVKVWCWLDILFLVDHNRNSEKRGTFPISDSFLQRRWDLSKKKVREMLKFFENEEMIELIRIVGIGTTLKVTNYADYQDFFIELGTTKETTKGTTKETTKGTKVKKDKERKENTFMLKSLSNIETPDDLEHGWFRNGFLECWKIYPKKVGKKEALKSWCKVHKKNKFQKQLAEDIYRGLQRYISQTEEKDREFIAHFSTWLNQRRWEDEETISLNHQKKKPKQFEQFSESDELPDLTFGGIHD